MNSNTDDQKPSCLGYRFENIETKTLQVMSLTPTICIVIGLIWILVALIGSAIYSSNIYFNPEPEFRNDPAIWALWGFVIFEGVLGVGMLLRAGWVRYPAIALCMLHLIGFPLGTVLGVFGLLALISGRKMFGRDRPALAVVRAEMRRRNLKFGVK